MSALEQRKRQAYNGSRSQTSVSPMRTEPVRRFPIWVLGLVGIICLVVGVSVGLNASLRNETVKISANPAAESHTTAAHMQQRIAGNFKLIQILN